MKFLLDVGISPQLGRLLEQDGPMYRYVPDYYSAKSDDAEILMFAAENDEVVLTHDTDFGTLLAFSGLSKPSVVLFRIHHVNAALFYQLISDNWPILCEPLETGALIVLETTSVRIKKLPFR